MSLVGLVQLTERLLNQTLQNAPQEPSQNASTATTQTNTTDANGDTFVPSSQNPGADAGIFQVTQVSLFSAAADLLLSQTAAPAAQPAAAPAAVTVATPAVSLSANNNDNGGAATALATGELAGLTANVASPQATATAATTASQNNNANAATNGPTNTAANTNTASSGANAAAAFANGASGANTPEENQTQLSNLNASLAALGLSQDEITVVDRVAQLIKDFNPAALSDIINQLQALAQAEAPQTAQAAANANATTSATVNGAGNVATANNVAAANGNNSTSAAFTLQGVAIQFNAVNETTANPKGQGAGNAETRLSAFQLQVQAVTLTLNNIGNGTTTRIQAPQNATANAPVLTAKARAAAA